MYMLANGKEVSKTAIVDAYMQGKAGIICCNGTNQLILHITPLAFNSMYFVNGKEFLVMQPSDIECALEAAYF